MKKIFFLFLLVFTFHAKAQHYKSEDGIVSFFSKAPLENIDATSKRIVSIINIPANEIVFSVPINSFQFKNKKMQEDFNDDFMDTDKYPVATYKGKINEKIDWTKDGTYKITSKGTLTIHGIAKERIDTATVTVKDERTRIESNFYIKVADHSIKIPTLLFEKIAEVVLVKVSVSYHIGKNQNEVYNDN